MDYQQKYEQIVTAYNKEKDRGSREETFRALTELVAELDAQQGRRLE